MQSVSSMIALHVTEINFLTFILFISSIVIPSPETSDHEKEVIRVKINKVRNFLNNKPPESFFLYHGTNLFQSRFNHFFIMTIVPTLTVHKNVYYFTYYGHIFFCIFVRLKSKEGL